MADDKKKKCTTVCTAYANFCATISCIEETYSELHPCKGKICGVRGPLNTGRYPPMEPTMEFLRGGMISVMASWEAYVDDLLREAFDILLIIGGDDSEKFYAIWPAFHTLYQNAFQHRQEGKHYSYPKTEAKVVARQLLGKPWSDLVKEECESQLGKRGVNLRFCGSNGINEIFTSIFQSKKKISDRVLKIGITYEFRDTPNLDVDTVQVRISDEKALEDLLRLYYGVRCVFAHGKAADKSLLDGALKDFPEDPEKLGVPKRVAVRIIELYQRVKKYRTVHDKAWVSYYMLVNMYTFFKSVGKCLCRAVAEWFDETFKKKKFKVWEQSIQYMEKATGDPTTN